MKKFFNREVNKMKEQAVRIYEGRACPTASIAGAY